MKKLILNILACFLIVIGVQAQSIRKPWRELTSSERTTYVNAINTLISNGTWQQFVDDHRAVDNEGNEGGFAQHNNDLFLPWHKYYLHYMEQEMGVPLVYWDWEYNQNGLTEWSGTSPMFYNADTPDAGTNGLFGRNLNSSVADSLGRTLKFSSPVGTVAGYLDQTNFTSFRSALEYGLHGDGHCNIGGIMCDITESPTDPTFYLHHSMVDKVYQEWVDLYWQGSNLFSITPIGTVTGENTENPNNHIDSRSLKVWYADDHLVELDNYAVTGTETYNYTTGDIEASDFVVPNTTSCTFMADNGYQIILKPGFEAKSGSSFHAVLSDIAANGRLASNEISGDSWVNHTEELLAENALEIMNIFPNPSTGLVRISLPQSMLETFDYKRDYLGEDSKVRELRGTVEIYSLKGELVMSKEILEEDIPYVNLRIKEKGIFIIKVQLNHGNAHTTKVIIQ